VLSAGLQRFLRYSTVGVGAFGIDLSILYVATSMLGISYYISTPCTFLIAVSVNYAVSSHLVFLKTERAWRRGYVYFAGAAIIGTFITRSLVAMLVTYASLYYLIARVIVASIVGTGNYLFNLFVNFKVVAVEQEFEKALAQNGKPTK